MPKKTNSGLEIDFDTADRIVACSLKDSILSLRGEIKIFKDCANPSEWQKLQLAEEIITLDAMVKVYFHYTGKKI